MIEELPVLETEVIEPDGVDLSLYRRIGEEVTRVVRHKLGMLYVKEINALRTNMTSFHPRDRKVWRLLPCR